jgi:hypothetical protein
MIHGLLAKLILKTMNPFKSTKGVYSSCKGANLCKRYSKASQVKLARVSACKKTL